MSCFSKIKSELNIEPEEQTTCSFIKSEDIKIEYEPNGENTDEDVDDMLEIDMLDIKTEIKKEKIDNNDNIQQIDTKICKEEHEDSFVDKCYKGADLPKYVCDLCGKTYKVKWYLQQHKYRGLCKRISCNICKKEFLNNDLFQRHLATHEIYNEMFKCGKCEKEFKSKMWLDNHLKNCLGNRIFKCKKCRQIFLSSRALQKHKINSLQACYVKCNICGKNFKEKSFLIIHKRFHFHFDHFECDMCGEKFNTKVFLELHIKINHSDTGVIFNCQQCDEQFNIKHNLVAHMKTHIFDYNLKCHDCERTFRYIGSLRKHQKTHLFYPCQLCGKVLKSKREFAIHKLTHKFGRRVEYSNDHNFKSEDNRDKEVLKNCKSISVDSKKIEEIFGSKFVQFKCDKCEKAFVNLLYLEKHEINVHN